MTRLLVGTAAALALAAPAAAQQGGSTYGAGSNVPQRTAGEVGPKTVGAMGGSGGPTAKPKPAKKGAKASAKGRRKPQG